MTRFHLAIAMVVTIGLPNLVLAEEDNTRPPARANAGNFRERLLKEFDADGDGKLSGPEQEKARAAAMKLRGSNTGRPNSAEMMKQFDKDGDGRLSDSERTALRQFMAKRGAGGNASGRRPQSENNKIPPQVLQRFDKDGDGKLDEKERQAAIKAREEFMKRNGDASGRDQRGRQTMNREDFIKKFDTDGDGKLDDGERAAAREAMSRFRDQRTAGAARGGTNEPRKPRVDKRELLEKFDADGDGKLNDDERAKAREEFQNRKRS